MPSVIPPDIASQIVDPNGGFLCLSTHWRPKKGAANPEYPGEKLQMLSFIPVRPGGPCLCGSGKPYAHCCRQLPYMHPVCIDPDGGYSLAAPQTAVFDDVDNAVIAERLIADTRLKYTDADPEHSFWVLFGDPPIENQYGILCLGDIELKPAQLMVTAMTDNRMENLLNVIDDILGDLVGNAIITKNPVETVHKTKPGKGNSSRPRKPKPKRR